MLSIIVAFTDEDYVIGENGSLPWKLKEDLEYFKHITTGHTVIMGSKTFESIGKPLSNRHNVILTRQNKNSDIENVEYCNNLYKTFKKYKYSEDETFVIGGANIYEQALKFADKIYATIIYEKVKGDAFFKPIDSKYWVLSKSSGIKVSSEGMVYTFNEYIRKTEL